MNLNKNLLWLGPLVGGLIVGGLIGYAQNPVTRAIRVAEKLGASQKLEDKQKALEMLSKQKDIIRLATINARVENARRLIALSLADRLIAQKMWLEAKKYLDIAHDILPGSTGIAYREGLVYYNLAYTSSSLVQKDNYRKQAEERLLYVIKQEPSNPDALYLLCLMALEQNNLEAAYQYIAQAYKVNPKNIDILFALARVYYEMGEYEQAKKVYGKLQSILPKNDQRWDTVERNLEILNKR